MNITFWLFLLSRTILSECHEIRTFNLILVWVDKFVKMSFEWEDLEWQLGILTITEQILLWRQETFNEICFTPRVFYLTYLIKQI